MEELIKVDYTNAERPTVLGRELHEVLEVNTPYHKWFPRMCDYGFIEGTDFLTVDKKVLRADGTEMPQTQYDHQLTIPMAKEICMLQRSEKGKYFRQYFISIEEAWNTPEMVMRRAMQIADQAAEKAKERIRSLTLQIQQDKPKTVFADAVAVSSTSILIGELAKLLKQNGVKMGQKRLFEWMRDNGYLIKREGSDRNMPTQRSMEMGLFEIKETVISHPDGHTHIVKTPKVTGKGQIYFTDLFLKKDEPEEIFND